MTLTALGDLSVAIQIHLACALAALVIGPFALYRRRRDLVHKVAGYLWIVAMAVLAGSGFFITGLAVIGPFGPIHILSGLVLWWLWSGVSHIRAGRRAAHAETMRSLYWNAIGLAGLLTLIPHRTLNRLVFPDAPHLGWVAIALGGALLALRFAYISGWIDRFRHAIPQPGAR